MEMDEKEEGLWPVNVAPNKIAIPGTAHSAIIWVPQAFGDLPRLCYVQFKFITIEKSTPSLKNSRHFFSGFR